MGILYGRPRGKACVDEGLDRAPLHRISGRRSQLAPRRFVIGRCPLLGIDLLLGGFIAPRGIRQQAGQVGSWWPPHDRCIFGGGTGGRRDLPQ